MYIYIYIHTTYALVQVGVFIVMGVLVGLVYWQLDALVIIIDQSPATYRMTNA